MKKENNDDVFLIYYKNHKREMKFGTIICFVGTIILLILNQFETAGFVFGCTIILFILFLIARKNIKIYETNRNSRKH